MPPSDQSTEDSAQASQSNSAEKPVDAVASQVSNATPESNKAKIARLQAALDAAENRAKAAEESAASGTDIDAMLDRLAAAEARAAAAEAKLNALPTTTATPPAAIDRPATSEVHSAADSVLVSIYNKSPQFGDFVHDVYGYTYSPDGALTGIKVIQTYRAQAQAFSQVPKWLADLWKKQCPNQIVDSSVVGAPTDHAPTSEEGAKLSKENADLKARLDNMEKLVADLKKQG